MSCVLSVGPLPILFFGVKRDHHRVTVVLVGQSEEAKRSISDSVSVSIIPPVCAPVVTHTSAVVPAVVVIARCSAGEEIVAKDPVSAGTDRDPYA